MKSLITLIFLLFANLAYAQPILYGQVGVPIIVDLPTYVASDKGFFKKRNLDVPEPIRFNGSAISFVALIRGDIKFISAGLFIAIQDRYNNAPISIGKAVTYSASYLYVAPRIKSMTDLRGKKVTAGGENDITRYHAEIMLEANGVTDNDWHWAPDAAKRLMALSSGEISAAVLIPPFTFMGDQQGFTRITKVSDYKQTYHKGLVFQTEWANSNPEKVQAITDAINESIEWIYDEKNRTEAAQILSKYSGSNIESSLNSYDLALKDRYFILDNTISKSIIDHMVSVARKWGNIKRPNIPMEEIVLKNIKITP